MTFYRVVGNDKYSNNYFMKQDQILPEEMTEEQRLLYKIMRNYDRSSRPVFHATTPVVIRLGITLTQILDVDEKNQILTTNVWLDQEWIDEKLKWDNISEFQHIKILRIPCDLIWLPDVVLYNSVDSHNKGYMKALAMVGSDGNVFWPPIVRMRSSCKMDITYFPFDDQICTLKLGSWAYDGFQVDVTNRTLDIDLSNYVDNGEWTLVDTKAVRNVKYYTCCPEPFPDVTFYVHLRRRVLYYAFNVIIPCVLLSMLTLTGFLLPPESGEKVTLGLTVLLAFSVFMLLIAENMPPTSEYIPLIGIYLTVIMSMSGLSVVFSVFVLNIHHRGSLAKCPPKYIKTFAKIMAKVLCMTVRLDNQMNYNTVTSYTSDRSFLYPSHENEALLQNDIGRHNNMNHVDINEKTNETLTDVMNQNVHMNSTNVFKTTFDKELLTYFKQVMLIHDNSMTERRAIHEWQEVARVVDRLSFCLFLLITGTSTIVLLVISPMTKDIRLD